MNRVFVTLPTFDKLWTEARLTDLDLSKLQAHLLANPKSGDAVQGTNGLRKLRWNLPGQGKRGSVRVFYLDLETRHLIFLLTILKKNEKSDLAPLEIKLVRKLIASIKDAYRRKGDG